MAEGFNIMNRDNKKITSIDNGFTTTAADFQTGDYRVSSRVYPGRYVLNPQFMQPQSSYTPRQLQFSVRLRF
jgi:hypothetical protein